MPRKSRKSAPKCAVCGGKMKIRGLIPAAHIYPELKTYQCGECGVSRTVEDERELAASATSAAA